MARTPSKKAIASIDHLPDREDFMEFAEANPRAGDPYYEGTPDVTEAEVGVSHEPHYDEEYFGADSSSYGDESRSLYTPHEFTLEQWKEWFKAQSIGSLPYNAVICHHTYRPSQYQWAGLQHVHNLRAYYRNTYGWPDGRMPHFFITDGRGNHTPGTPKIFTATHPAHDGIHCINANSRTIGIEAVHDGEASPFTKEMVELYREMLSVLAARRGGKVFAASTWYDGPSKWNGIRIHKTVPGNGTSCYGTRNMPFDSFYKQVSQGVSTEPPKPPEPNHPGAYQLGRYNFLAYSDEDKRIATALAESVRDQLSKELDLKVTRLAFLPKKIEYGSLSSYNSPADNKVWAIVVGSPTASYIYSKARNDKLLSKNDQSFSETGHQNLTHANRNDRITAGESLLRALCAKEKLSGDKASEAYWKRIRDQFDVAPPTTPKPTPKPTPSGKKSMPGGYWGVKGGVVASPFNQYRPNAPAQLLHKGIDISAPTGTPTYALMDGVVIRSRNGGVSGYNQEVTIEYDCSEVSEFVDKVYVLYGHMGKNTILSMNARVKRGDLVAKVGTSADAMNTAPHCHLQMWTSKDAALGYNNDRAVDPKFLREVLEPEYVLDKDARGSTPLPTSPSTRGIYDFLGVPRYSEAEMTSFFKSIGVSDKGLEIVPHYFNQYRLAASKYGSPKAIAPDALLLQAAHETGLMKWGGASRPWNMAGIKKAGNQGDATENFEPCPDPERGVDVHYNYMAVWMDVPQYGYIPPRAKQDLPPVVDARGHFRTMNEVGGHVGRYATDPNYSKHLKSYADRAESYILSRRAKQAN